MKNDILLLGGGGHCHCVIDIIEKENKFNIAGIIDKKELVGTRVLGYDIIGCDDDLEQLFDKYKYAFITLGHIRSNSLRIKLFNKLKDIGYSIPTIISPLAYISQYASIEEGTVVHHHALVNTNAKIGKNCIINSKALVEHDVVVEDNTHISTSAVINGGVVVKENSFIGSGTIVKEYIEVSGFNKAGELLK